ncbi:hypothetical protein HZU72_21120 [Halomonas sp. QX-2]|uniref:Uncharacterized protein n=1 Tax=Vreelandella sedimenti TaxID=2729618 RepID=A0A7Z0NBD3_9GAMM|nr:MULTISPECIES: hypothetical protein [Halomonas]NYT74892.1 hypothetical protein [Halomonas sedimenti]|tara:strand:+ start:10966 stop:11475 length:510 start_codon:yes stop_codon:yes gene_type:complete
MIWHLIAAVFAGLAAAGIGLILRNLSGKRLPKWIVPVCGGLGMLGYQVQVEYSWFDHKQAQLPETATVISTESSTAVWRPWTFAIPMITKFSMVDSENIRITEQNDTRLAEFILYQFERHHTDILITQPYLLNCESRELVPLDKDSRDPILEEIRTLRETSPLLNNVCA